MTSVGVATTVLPAQRRGPEEVVRVCPDDGPTVRTQRSLERIREVLGSGRGRAVDREPPPLSGVALQHESDDVLDESSGGHRLEAHGVSLADGPQTYTPWGTWDLGHSIRRHGSVA